MVINRSCTFGDLDYDWLPPDSETKSFVPYRLRYENNCIVISSCRADTSLSPAQVRFNQFSSAISVFSFLNRVKRLTIPT